MDESKNEMTELGSPYPWLSEQWDQICQRSLDDHLPHALLLAGQRGVGKLDFAVNLARYVLCSGEKGSGKKGSEKNTSGTDVDVSYHACGKCRHCHLLSVGTHPDYVGVFPEEKGKAIKIDQIRELIKFSGQTSQLAGYKVVVIAPSDAMNVNSANAVLKCLEEPAPKTLMILVTDEPHALMATIRSRCQIISFATPSRTVSKSWLMGHFSDESKVDELLAVTGGEPLTALQNTGGQFLDDRKAILSGLIKLTEGVESPLSLAAAWHKLDVPELLTWLSQWIIGAAKFVHLGEGGEQLEVQQEEGVLFRTLLSHQSFAPEKLHYFSDELCQATSKLHSTANPNKQLLLEELLIKWRKIMLS